MQLSATYTTHGFSNDNGHLMLDVFLRAIGRRGVLSPVNGASFAGPNLAPNSIGTVFTGPLAAGLQVASAGPEAGLGGVTATLRGSTNVELPVPWFFVSPGQGSFLTPGAAAPGAAVLKIVSGPRRWAIPTNVALSAPGVFAANGDGRGAPAAAVLRVKPDNVRSSEFPFVLDAAAGRYVAGALRFGEDRLFLDLYATGVRLADPAKVQVLIGGEPVTPLYAGAQPQFIGLDQVTLELPRSLAGRGRVEVIVVADGVRANPVELLFAN